MVARGIDPASLSFTGDGTPYSERYDDVYHSADGGPAQARHVFLAGNDLPGRWQGRERFVVLETGFGTGLNFLATWLAWQRDPSRCRRLHFISFELHPFAAADLALIHARWPEFAVPAAQLRAQWPALVPGMHRLHFDGDAVALTLYFGDAAAGLALLSGDADAFFLDGFAPARNPGLWSSGVFGSLARHAAPGATLATWSVAGDVREGLKAAGFAIDRAPGFGSKREMLRGRRPGEPAVAVDTDVSALARAAGSALDALVIGAGLAGSSVAERLASRGRTVAVLDEGEHPAAGASGNHAGALRPLPSLDDNRTSRWIRAGTLHGWRHIRQLAATGLPVRSDPCGVLHLAADAAQEARMRAAVERQCPPPTHLRYVEAAEAATLCGWPVAHGGWWFADSGWVQPHSLCRQNLAVHGARIRCHYGRRVAGLEWRAGVWHALDAAGATIAAAAVTVLATGAAVGTFEQAAWLPIARARGQATLLDAAEGGPPRVVVCGGGYATPAVDGRRVVGASFDLDDDDPQLRDDDHRANLARLDLLLPGYVEQVQPSIAGGRVGFRPISPDRLPMIGSLPVFAARAGKAEPPPAQELPRHPGLFVATGFATRGLVWATLAGELLASMIDGDPLPLERDLVDAVDPARFLRGRGRRGVSAAPPTSPTGS